MPLLFLTEIPVTWLIKSVICRGFAGTTWMPILDAAHWCHFINARKLKHSLNKRLELGRAVMQEGPKLGRSPVWDDQSAVTKGWESSNRRHDGTCRRAEPVVLISPVLNQGVNATAANGTRVEPWNLGVVIGHEPINCVRASFGINNSKYRRIDGPVIFVHKSA